MKKKENTSFKPVETGKKLPEMEKEILKFWKDNKIFEKSLENRKGSKEYAFYDGPPFATGNPHYGHIVASVMKDVVPRYWTMRGRYVERKWGWDCHGLPIENIVEKELGSKKKKDIEEMGVEKFNELCRSKVLGYVDEWKKTINRLGRWADMDNAYKTMDLDYMESVWWTFKELWDKGLIYEDYRSMHICPRCETTLSQSEVSEGYKDVKDLSVIAKFEVDPTNLQINYKSTNSIKDNSQESMDNQQEPEVKTYILAWTTTPWTLPGNVALAVGKDIDYVMVKKENENFILAKELLEKTFGEVKNKKVFLISGKHAFASRKYFPKLKKQLENNDYNVTIVDHINSNNPNLKENLQLLSKHDLANAHIITHSLGASTILKYLNDTKITLSSLTMIAPTRPGIKFTSTNPQWIKDSGYFDFTVDYKKITSRITNAPTIIYSNENIISEDNFKQLGKELGAEIIKENDKSHYFEEDINNFPDFDIVSYLNGLTNYKIVKEMKGSDLVGLKYKPLWATYASDEKLKNREQGWKIYSANFVTTEEGTGIVHIAPAFGEDDMKLGKEKNLPFIQHVGMDGMIDEKVEAVGGLNVKPVDNPQATDVEVIKYLASKGLLFYKEKYEHSYPHCWRCDTPLINYATGSWFVAVTKIKERALELAKKINWSPENMKEGRFGNWLEGARDWSISRQRFWASVMPIWVCDKCEERKVFGSVAELEKISGEKITDLHKHVVDKITFKCNCGGTMKRVPDVLDTWFDSGSMPYAQKHYPFENKEDFDKTFPADFIAEGVDQTRAWFYYLHIIATGIKDKQAFKNVIVNGIVLAEDGKKMSKKLQNYPDPNEMLEKYGADTIRYYLMSSPVVSAQNLNFSEKDVAEITRGMMRMLWNSYSFFVMYANIDKLEIGDMDFAGKFSKSEDLKNLLDRWIVSELHILIQKVNEEMEAYRLHKTARLFPKFIDNLSNWYIRRSRKRFWKSENDDDKSQAYATLHYVLTELAKLMAPFTPFVSEEIYKNLTGKTSVHLEDFPIADEKFVDENLNRQMRMAREIIQTALQLRTKAGIKVRQPLSQLIIEARTKTDKKSGLLGDEFTEIIKEEINVKQVVFDKFDFDEEAKNMGEVNDVKLFLDVEITPELKLEGQAREIIRFIQQMRKEADYQLDDRIKVWHSGMSEVFDKFGNLIAKETLAIKIEPLQNSNQKFDLKKEFKIDGEKLEIGITVK